MKIVKVSTKNPMQLMKDINCEISSNAIRTWEFDEINKISHKGEQYKGHFEFEYKIDDAKGILEFIYHSKGNTYADSKSFSLLESMLKAHFEDKILIV